MKILVQRVNGGIVPVDHRKVRRGLIRCTKAMGHLRSNRAGKETSESWRKPECDKVVRILSRMLSRLASRPRAAYNIRHA